MSESSLTEAYAQRLKARISWLKRLLRVQAPYRWNLRRLKPGYTLDVGCGLGRNLGHIGGHGVGVDPNTACLSVARAAGLTVYTPEAFAASPEARPGAFDSMVVSHVLEHMTEAEGEALLRANLPYVRPGGQLILITPQEAGYAIDNTHVAFIDDAKLAELAERLGAVVERNFSFPFPRPVGRLFRYNEFVVTARVPEGVQP